MNQNNLALTALALDLKRVALALHRGSNEMAERFTTEAGKRCAEIAVGELPGYMQKIVGHIRVWPRTKATKTTAEDALMYSTLIQNYALSKLR